MGYWVSSYAGRRHAAQGHATVQALQKLATTPPSATPPQPHLGVQLQGKQRLGLQGSGPALHADAEQVVPPLGCRLGGAQPGRHHVSPHDGALCRHLGIHRSSSGSQRGSVAAPGRKRGGQGALAVALRQAALRQSQPRALHLPLLHRAAPRLPHLLLPQQRQLAHRPLQLRLALPLVLHQGPPVAQHGALEPGRPPLHHRHHGRLLLRPPRRMLRPASKAALQQCCVVGGTQALGRLPRRGQVSGVLLPAPKSCRQPDAGDAPA